MLIGYARVSKADGSQSLDLQRDALLASTPSTSTTTSPPGVRDDRPGPTAEEWLARCDANDNGRVSHVGKTCKVWLRHGLRRAARRSPYD